MLCYFIFLLCLFSLFRIISIELHAIQIRIALCNLCKTESSWMQHSSIQFEEHSNRLKPSILRIEPINSISEHKWIDWKIKSKLVALFYSLLQWDTRHFIELVSNEIQNKPTEMYAETLSVTNLTGALGFCVWMPHFARHSFYDWHLFDSIKFE